MAIKPDVHTMPTSHQEPLPFSFASLSSPPGEIFQVFFMHKELAAIKHVLLGGRRAFPPWTFLERIIELSSEVSPEPDMDRIIHRIIADIAVCLQTPMKNDQNHCQVFLSLSQLFTQNGVMLGIAASTV